MSFFRTVLIVLAAACSATATHALERGKPVHAVSMYDTPKHGPDFKHFDFVNPDAPKGGTLVRATEGDRTFDTFNVHSLKGAPIRSGGLMHDTLMFENPDEVFAMYGHVAETIEIAPDNSWVQFKLRPQAKFSDGSPITAEDVVFSFEILTTQGVPIYRLYWADVEKAEAVNKSTVKFSFKTKDNRELPLILGQVPVLSKAYWSKRDFTASTLEIPVVSGPYIVDTFEPGRFVTMKRVPNYWAKDLPVTRGLNNFERIRYEYFRDDDVRFEAFKTGGFDVYRSTSAREWATAYDFPAMKDGKIRKIELTDGMPMTTQSFVMNMRKPLFQDARVREALNYAFDFESLNKTVFYNSYTRIRSYWQKSELEATGLPSPAELKLLEPLRGKIPDRVFTAEFTQPKTDGQGNPRDNLRKATELLRAAGWVVENGKLVKSDTKAPFEFEFLLNQPSYERVVLPYLQNLQRLGIKASVRNVDSTQYVNRLDERDFDMTSLVMPYGLSPGNELVEDWGTASADRNGSRNYGGVKDAAIDALADHVIRAQTRDDVVAAARAFDRALTWNYYRILTYSSASERYAVWNKIKAPSRAPVHGIGSTGALIDQLWWMDPAEIAAEKAKP
jgi:microcin C transport system substrate-binding protein